MEGSVGEGVLGGGGVIVTNAGTSPIAFGGAGVKTPIASASGGLVGFPTGIGLYAEGFLGSGGWRGGGLPQHNERWGMQPGCPLGNNYVSGTGFSGLERASPLAVVGGNRIHSLRHGDRMDQVLTEGQGRGNAPIQPSVVNRRVHSDHRGRAPVAVGAVVSTRLVGHPAYRPLWIWPDVPLCVSDEESGVNPHLYPAG